MVQELDTGGDIKFTHINNDIKNGQKEVSRTFIGVERQGVH